MKSDKVRSDRPSGRQASVQPEHSGEDAPATSSLHQGQGPDFQTQDDDVRRGNEGVQQLLRKEKPGHTTKPHQQPITKPAEVSGSNEGLER